MILLDTHVVIWWADGSPGLLVSAISCWEVAVLVDRGRLALGLEVERWLTLLASHPAVRLLPTPTCAACGEPKHSARPPHHKLHCPR